LQVVLELEDLGHEYNELDGIEEGEGDEEAANGARTVAEGRSDKDTSDEDSEGDDDDANTSASHHKVGCEVPITVPQALLPLSVVLCDTACCWRQLKFVGA
jgi:hypothetical protein